MKSVFPERTLYREFLAASGAGFDIIRSVFNSKILRRQ
jgi:hypothetical protein